MSLKDLWNLTTFLVFAASGVFILLIDGSDLSTKGLKKEQRLFKIVGYIYIFGSALLYIIVKMIP